MYDDLTNYPKPLNDIPEESFTLPNWMYTDPDVYELEKERIFYRTWQYIGHKALFKEPGDYVTARICDQNVFVIKGGDGELRAFYNVCQHRAHELLPDGVGNVERAIVCPYHAWTFSREGLLRGGAAIKKRKRLAVHLRLQDRKIRAPAFGTALFYRALCSHDSAFSLISSAISSCPIFSITSDKKASSSSIFACASVRPRLRK